jgi:hypothetical protein
LETYFFEEMLGKNAQMKPLVNFKCFSALLLAKFAALVIMIFDKEKCCCNKIMELVYIEGKRCITISFS